MKVMRQRVQTSFTATNGVSAPGQSIQLHSLGTGTGPTPVVSSRRRHTSCYRDWSSDVCSSDLADKIDQTGGKVVAANLGARAVQGISLTSTTNDADTVAFLNTDRKSVV